MPHPPITVEEGVVFDNQNFTSDNQNFTSDPYAFIETEMDRERAQKMTSETRGSLRQRRRRGCIEGDLEKEGGCIEVVDGEKGDRMKKETWSGC